MADQIDIRIYYEDTDCGGVVYYGKYLTYLEWARTEYLESRGLRLTELMGRGVLFVVVHVDINYMKPARYADILTVITEVDTVTYTTIGFNHKILLKGTDTQIALSRVKLACVSNDMKPARLQREIIDALTIKEPLSFK